MDISVIDKNLEVKTNINKEDIVWLDAAEEPFVVYGAASVNPYLRVSMDVASSVSSAIAELAKNTSGIRVRFKTDSSYIAIHCIRNGGSLFSHMPVLGKSGFDLFSLSKNSKSQNFVKAFVPPIDNTKGYTSCVDLKGEMADYILNFPLYDDVDKLYIGVQKDCKFETPSEYTNELPVVFYGSSITQGGCASRPGNSYQNFLSRMLDMDYINLGFSGNGVAQEKIVEYMSELKMEVLVSDYDHNSPSSKHLSETHYKMYSIIREKHPDLPYVMVSRPDYYIGSVSDDERRNVIAQNFAKAVADGDRNVYYIDGSSLFAGDEWQACTVDGCHPNDLGFYRFAKGLYPTLKHILKM